MNATTVSAAIAILLQLGAPNQDPLTFRASARTVLVDVSVKKGNNPISGLRAADFVVLDNGVPQEVAVLDTLAIPIDVSLFVDISGSTFAARSEIGAILRDVVKLLRVGDRFRLLTNGLSIDQPVGWTDAGAIRELPEIDTVDGISLVYDGVYAATLHKPAVGRRHLVIALTDGQDDCSVLRPADLPALAGRTESVVHWIPKGGFDPDPEVPHVVPHEGGRGACPYQPTKDTAPLAAFVLGTGGVVHGSIVESIVGNIFSRILDDYRQSYVLYYRPTVATPGWHRIEVAVPGGEYSVRARSGYFVD